MLESETVTPDQVEELKFGTELDILHMECQLERNTSEIDSDPKKLKLLGRFSHLNNWIGRHA